MKDANTVMSGRNDAFVLRVRGIRFRSRAQKYTGNIVAKNSVNRIDYFEHKTLAHPSPSKKKND